jgi:hypothetical protein
VNDAIASGVAALIILAALAADLIYEHARNLDHHTGRRRRQRDDDAMRRAAQQHDTGPRYRR